MKVLLNCLTPFSLAHGGAQIQIEQTKIALESNEVEVEFLRWWDDSQRGDLIHFFGLPASESADLTHQKGLKLVVTHLLGGLGARSAWKRTLQKMIIRTLSRNLPGVGRRAGWNAWKSADAYIAVTSWEGKLMREVFQTPFNRIHVVPNGVSDCFFDQPIEERGHWLVTAASILPVKRLLETAQAAVIAQTPFWIIGRPFSETDDYYQKFSTLCRQNPKVLRYDNVMRTQPELAKIYRQARGFVLLSRWESQSLAALEAAACECPLLLSDLPWARSTFGEYAGYCPIASPKCTAYFLKNFYDAAPTLPVPPKPASWNDIATQLKAIYEKALSTSR